jgi:hypothetical protein
MEYRILDNSLWRNSEDKFELFLQIEINDGVEIWNKAARISLEEVALVVADSSAINDVALRMANRAVITRPQEKIDEENNRLYMLEQVRLEAAQEEARVEQIKLEVTQEEARLEQIKLDILNHG